MNEYEEFLDGAAALIAAVFVLGMLASAVHTAYRDRQRMRAASGGTAAPLLPPDSTESSPMRVGAPPEAYKLYSLLITGCTDGMLWYANKVGQEVPYLGTWPSEGSHKSREDAGYVNIVKIKDARVIVRERNVK
jgi:hypothetical protein